MTRFLSVLVLMLAVSGTVCGQTAASASGSVPVFTTAAEAALDKRTQELTEQLRCLVCQNQTIADSHADLAIDLKRQVREKLAQGVSEKEIIDYMVQRYGDFVLYRPPVKSTTWLLWFGPFLLMLGGLALLLWKVAHRPQDNKQDITDADLQRAADLLHASDMKDST